MKKFKYTSLFIFFMSIFCLFSFFISPTNNLENNYSSAWTEYLASDDKTIYGDLIPEEYEMTANATPLASTSTLPSYYCLRDDCIIYTTDQSDFGLCWAYTMNTSLSTYIQLQYNEYYDFSPAWTSITTKKYNSEHGYSDYVLGGGGNVTYFKNALENYGVMLSTDFDLTDLFSVDNKNYETFYSLYKDYTFDISEYQTKIVTYTSSDTSDFKNAIKKHIQKYGSLYTSIKSKDIKNQTCLCSTIGGTTDHAVSIIGWDDEYYASSWSGKGAWIALNSWGDDWGQNGVFYISYNDVCANKTMSGIAKEEESATQPFIISDTSSSFENRLTNAYKYSGQNSITSLEGKIKNVFYSDKEVKIEYGYNFSSLNIAPTISIEKNNKDVRILFSQIETTSNSTLIKGYDVESGVYKVTFNFRFTDGNDLKIQKAFVVLDGTELCEIKLYSQTSSDPLLTNNVPYYYGSYNSYNKDQTYYEIYARSHTETYFYLYFSTYSYVQNYLLYSSENLSYSVSNALTKVSNTSYSRGWLRFLLVSSATSTVDTFTVKIRSQQGLEKTYQIKIYSSDYYENVKYAYTNVDYNGGTHVIPKEIVVTNNSEKKIYLQTPTKGTAIFEGWFCSTDGKNYTTKLPSDYSGYYITYSMLQSSKSKNYVLNYYNESYEINTISFNYIFLQAKWRFNSYTITYNYEDYAGQACTETETISSSNDIIYFKDLFTPDKDGYEYIWTSSFSGVDTKNKVIKNLNQDIIIYGKYVLLAPELQANKINDDETSTIVKTYNGSDVLLKANAEHSGENVVLKYIWKKQNMFGIFVKVSGETNSTLKLKGAKDSGVYICEITATTLNETNKESSKITTNPFNVTINKAQTIINYDLIEREFTYDGKTHIIDGASINHNETTVKYSNNILKDVGFNNVTIYTAETDNYLSASQIIEIKINKAKVTIKIDNKRSAVFAQKQNYTYEIKFGTVFEGDDLQLQYQTNANTIFAGTYDINAISLNNNYDVEIIGGTYTVYIEGLSFVLIIFTLVIITALGCLLVYFFIKRKSNMKQLNAKDFDDDIRFKD